MKITKDTDVSKFRESINDLGYIMKDRDEQIQFILDNIDLAKKDEVTIVLGKDRKTIIGYKYVSVQRLKGTRESRRAVKLDEKPIRKS